MKVHNANHNDWDQHIQPILFAYRVSIHESTQRTPYEMLFGTKPQLPTSTEVDPATDFDEAIARHMLLVSAQLTKTQSGGLQNSQEAQE